MATTSRRPWIAFTISSGRCAPSLHIVCTCRSARPWALVLIEDKCGGDVGTGYYSVREGSGTAPPGPAPPAAAVGARGPRPEAPGTLPPPLGRSCLGLASTLRRPTPA